MGVAPAYAAPAYAAPAKGAPSKGTPKGRPVQIAVVSYGKGGPLGQLRRPSAAKDTEGTEGSDARISDFIVQCGLDESATSLLQELEADVLEKVLTSFDPTGTKDGNVLGRLQGYIRAMTRAMGGGKPALKRPRY